MKNMKAVILLLTIFVLFSCKPTKKKTEEKYTANWESLSKHNEKSEWFRDAKFGIYFHWGAYTVPAFGHEWYPEAMYDKLRWYKKNDMHEHHVKTYGDPSEFGYHDFIPLFKAEKFKADDWADLFVKAGAKFAGPVAEHHDGFAMWDSEVTSWNVGKRGPKRDLTGELEKAIRKRGLKFITTFHHSRNRTREIEPGKWEGYYKFLIEHYPQIVEDPELAILYGYIPEEQFLQIWRNKLNEVIDKYQPDLMWFDTWLDEIPEQNRKDYLAYYFNKSKEWGKDVVVTCKQDDLPREVAIQDYERGRANRILDRPWLTDDAISRDTWSYVDGMVIKTSKTIVHELIDIVSKNGNLLLDISPRADGIIPEDQKQVLLGIGDWLKVNGEAIYNTRPWLVFGEGPSRLKKGGGFTGKMEYTSNDIRFTQSKDGKCLYAIVLGWPENNEVNISSLTAEGGLGSETISKVSLLGSEARIEMCKSDEGMKIKLPAKKHCEHAFALKFELQ